MHKKWDAWETAHGAFMKTVPQQVIRECIHKHRCCPWIHM